MLSVIQSCLLYTSIEIPDVIEIIEVPPITAVPGVPSYIKGIINVRSKIVPVVNIRSRFGKEEIPFNDRTCIITVSYTHLDVYKRQAISPTAPCIAFPKMPAAAVATLP